MLINWLGSSELYDCADPSTAQNILWSSGDAWRGVVVEAYRFQDLSTPDFQALNHVLLLHLTSPAPVELEADGRSDTRIRVPGDLSVIPAGTTCRVRMRVPYEVHVHTVSQVVIVRSGLELRQAGPFQPLLRTHVRYAQLEYICRALQA